MLMRSSKNLPSFYKGQLMASQLECKWAFFLDHLNIKWQYEPERLQLPSGSVYMPDFFLPELGSWLEIKGNQNCSRLKKTYELSCLIADEKPKVFVGLADGHLGFYLPDSMKLRPATEVSCSQCPGNWFRPLYGQSTDNCPHCHSHQDNSGILARKRHLYENDIRTIWTSSDGFNIMNSKKFIQPDTRVLEALKC